MTPASSVGAVGWTVASYARTPTPPFDLERIATSPTIPRELGAVLGGAATAWAIGARCRLVPGLRHARSRQQTIARLRQAGTRHDGVVADLEFRKTWLGHMPLFTMTVAYTDGGGRHAVVVHMLTEPARVPVLGSPMVVLTDGAGAVHVELGDQAEPRFEENYQRFLPSDGWRPPRPVGQSVRSSGRRVERSVMVGADRAPTTRPC